MTTLDTSKTFPTPVLDISAMIDETIKASLVEYQPKEKGDTDEDPVIEGWFKF